MAPLRNVAQHLGLLLVGSTIVSAAVPFDFCADLNTADMQAQKSIYQTNGLCFNTCKEKYAYAITQYQSCWCSNFTPDKSSQVSRGKCNTPCPAYPDEEQCGGDGVFAYIALVNEPSGTKGADSPSSTSESPKTTEESDDASSTPPASLTSSYVLTVTAGSIIKTVTVAPPAQTPDNSDGSSPEDNSNSTDSKKSGGLGTGGVVGIAVGVVAAVLIIAAVAVFWFLRRRKQSKEDGYQEDPSVRGTSPNTIGTAGGVDMIGGGPLSATNTSGNRSSMLQIDPRMDPFRGQGLYARSGSHESLNTLRDDHDYSRRIQQPLRATNPDPDVD